MAREDVTKILGTSPLFRGLAEADAARVAAYCRYRELKKGETLFREGDDAATFFVVARGRIKVFKESIDGRELIIKTMREGDLVGEAASLAGVPYPASAQAMEDAAAVEIPRREFVDLITGEPELALNIIAALSARLHQLSDILEKLTLKDVPARLASYLLEHAAAGPDGAEHVELDVTKTSLAAELGTVPETLSRALRRFADAGLILQEGKRIILADEASLRLVAGSGAE